MRRTPTLRLLIIDRSVLAKNMYELLFEDLPGFHLEFAESGEGLSERQRRARPHVILVNSNALEKEEEPDYLSEYPTIILLAPDRQDLKAAAQQHETVTLVEKPFYPYDLITVINRIGAVYHPLSRSTEPAPPPRRRRVRSSTRKART